MKDNSKFKISITCHCGCKCHSVMTLTTRKDGEDKVTYLIECHECLKVYDLDLKIQEPYCRICEKDTDLYKGVCDLCFQENDHKICNNCLKAYRSDIVEEYDDELDKREYRCCVICYEDE